MKVSYVVLRYLLTDHTGSLNFCIDDNISLSWVQIV